MKSLRHNLKKGLVVLLGAFILLAAYYCYVLFFYGDRWFANSYNPRVRLDAWEPKVIPGDIKDRKGQVLASTVKENRRNPETNTKQVFYYRSYSGGKQRARSSAHVVGYNDPQFGRSGVEALQIRYLLGYNNPFYERIYQKIFMTREVGNTLYLTIDADLQQYADDILGKHKGSVVVMDYQTGEVLAMVSHPTFNPNKLGEDIAGDALVSRATEGLYAPGSIFKIIVAASALENLENVLEETFDCRGTTEIGTQNISCYGGEAHGQVDLAQAMALSCNGDFARLGVEVGRAKLLKTGEAFGFNQDFIFPDLKLVASRLPLKPGVSKEKLALTSIGQGDVQVTPLHMAMVASAVANRGIMMEPKLVYQVVGRNGKVQKALESRVYRKSMSEEVSQTIHDMMKDVVSEGTGKAAAIKGKQVAGKTGTAEIVDEDSGTRNNAWFIGFVSDSKSKVAIALVLEDMPSGQTGGKAAAPLAGKILKKAVDLGY
ncbi:MAG: peptidoglycan D,D-transpeptidase FtsI family protein [Caldicoprobacterales bacterium]|jgi:peptidoglycan glycosyltransferase|nr:penicillin-binding protein 2 [Clostridiales bacterium]